MRRTKRVKDWVIAHPAVDLLAPAVTAGVTLTAGFRADDDAMRTVMVGASTTGALVLTAATFAASMVYGSSVDFMVEARRRFHHQISKNWMSVIIWCFLATVAPLLACLAPSAWMLPTLAGSLAILGAKLLRCLFWFGYTLKLDVASAHTPRIDKFRPAPDLERRMNG